MFMFRYHIACPAKYRKVVFSEEVGAEYSQLHYEQLQVF
jgi:hypothetical protein